MKIILPLSRLDSLRNHSRFTDFLALVEKHAAKTEAGYEFPSASIFNACKAFLSTGKFEPKPEPSQPQPHQAVSRDKWPLILKPITALANQYDMGVGDTIHRCLSKLGADTLSAWYTRITGTDCGCGDRQAKLNTLYPYECDLVLDGTHCGNGDLILGTWIAEAHRMNGKRVGFLAHDGYQQIVKLFGHSITQQRTGTVMVLAQASYRKELEEGGFEPRVTRWQRTELGYSLPPSRPIHHIPEQEQAAADKFLKDHNHNRRPVAVIYPIAAHKPRRWPYYLSLARTLERSGFRTVTLDGAGSQDVLPFPLWARGMSWYWQAALINRASVVIGNDSAGTHLAGTLGARTIAIMGPTRPAIVFGHMPNVTCVGSGYKCADCHFKYPIYTAACDPGCKALAEIPVRKVAETVCAMFGMPVRMTVPELPGHGYTPLHEAQAVADLLEGIGAQTVFEIGTAEGRFAAQMLQTLPMIRRWIGIDVPPDHISVLPQEQYSIPKDAGHMAKGYAAYKAMVRPGGSLSVKAEELPQCDAVFIDGDHSLRGVEHDTALAQQIVRPGGLIIWHDYAKPGMGVQTVADRLGANVVTGTCVAWKTIGDAK